MIIKKEKPTKCLEKLEIMDWREAGDREERQYCEMV